MNKEQLKKFMLKMLEELYTDSSSSEWSDSSSSSSVETSPEAAHTVFHRPTPDSDEMCEDSSTVSPTKKGRTKTTSTVPYTAPSATPPVAGRGKTTSTVLHIALCPELEPKRKRSSARRHFTKGHKRRYYSKRWYFNSIVFIALFS